MKNLRFYYAYKLILSLPQFHGCWQKSWNSSARDKGLLLPVIAQPECHHFCVPVPWVPVSIRRHEEGQVALVHALCCIICEKPQTKYLIMVSKQLWRKILFVLPKAVCCTNILEKSLEHRTSMPVFLRYVEMQKYPWKIGTFIDMTKSPCPEEYLLLA